MAGLGRSTFRTILTVFQDNRFNPVRGILPLTVHPDFVQRWPAGSVALRAGSVDLDGWIWCPSLASYRPRAAPGGGAALAALAALVPRVRLRTDGLCRGTWNLMSLAIFLSKSLLNV